MRSPGRTTPNSALAISTRSHAPRAREPQLPRTGRRCRPRRPARRARRSASARAAAGRAASSAARGRPVRPARRAGRTAIALPADGGSRTSTDATIGSVPVVTVAPRPRVVRLLRRVELHRAAARAAVDGLRRAVRLARRGAGERGRLPDRRRRRRRCRRTRSATRCSPASATRGGLIGFYKAAELGPHVGGRARSERRERSFPSSSGLARRRHADDGCRPPGWSSR